MGSEKRMVRSKDARAAGTHIWLCHSVTQWLLPKSVTASRYGTCVTPWYRGYGYGIAVGQNFPDCTRGEPYMGQSHSVPCLKDLGIYENHSSKGSPQTNWTFNRCHQCWLDPSEVSMADPSVANLPGLTGQTPRSSRGQWHVTPTNKYYIWILLHFTINNLDLTNDWMNWLSPVKSPFLLSGPPFAKDVDR
jgi:hypothetical protein